MPEMLPASPGHDPRIRRYVLIAAGVAVLLAAWGILSRLYARIALEHAAAGAAIFTVATTHPSRGPGSDLLVLPSTGEGFPLVVQEALASGLPIICGRETLEADPALKNFVLGAPVDERDDDRTAHEFLRAIGDFLDTGAGEGTPEERHALAQSRYSWESAVERYLELASRLISERASPAEAEAGK